jgi:predicted esterase
MKSDPLSLFTTSIIDNNSKKTIFLFHGTGGNETDLFPLIEPFTKTHTIVGLRGNILEHGMPRFFKRVSEGIFDLENLKEETEKLAVFLKAWYIKYSSSPDKSIFIGYSNGANFILSELFTHPELVQNAAVLHAMLPFAPPQSLDLSGHTVLLTRGLQDPIITPEQSGKLLDTLKKGKAQLTVLETDIGHAITEEELHTLHSFCNKIL